MQLQLLPKPQLRSSNRSSSGCPGTAGFQPASKADQHEVAVALGVPCIRYRLPGGFDHNAYTLTIVGLLLALCCPAKALAQNFSTVLPTDITPTTPNLERTRPENALQLRMWQRLPSSFFFNTSVETSLRLETNPFQYPLKRTLVRQLLAGQDPSQLTSDDVTGFNQQLNRVSRFDSIYRINPNVTAGWALTPNTQVFANYFLLRDSVFNSSSLNSTTKTVGFGAQSTWNLTPKTTIQPQILVRELYQTAEPNVTDYLPALTLQYQSSPNLVAYINTLLQVRMLHGNGPQRELNPFYTAGMVYQRGRWQVSASGTFLQNIRKPFVSNAIIPISNDSFILDFEVDRQPFVAIPGLQAFVRAEPVYNFASHATPGLAGMDFRLYYGLRMTVGKPPLNGTVNQLMQRYKQSSIGPIPTTSMLQMQSPSGTRIRRDIASQL